MNDIAIQVSGLGRAFGEMWAVRGLDLEVRRGEIFGLVGPDGAGKTTTMRMLTGILAASEGTATVAGFSIQGGEEEIKSRISYMSQRFGLYGDLTVEEAVSLIRGPRGTKVKLSIFRKLFPAIFF